MVARTTTCGLRVRHGALLALVGILGGVALVSGCGGGGAYSASRTKAEATPQLQPIPSPDRLARPKSLDQPGTPDAARALLPLDDPRLNDKVALGEKLFFDGRLSADGSVACASCHNPALAFTDARPVSIGIKGRVGQRNAPTILNALFNPTQFWDGRAKTLEDQAMLPIINPSEMGEPSLGAAVERIAKEYRKAFLRAFDRPPNSGDLLTAIATYERTQVSFDSPFDHFAAGNQSAIDKSAQRGWALFNGRARCNKCHALPQGPNRLDPTYFSDHSFHNIGLLVVQHNAGGMANQAQQLVNPSDTPAVDRSAIQSDMALLGRYLVTRRQSDIGAFKTPNLRNVVLTAPYFHDGSHRTLWDVLDHYNKGGEPNSVNLDKDMQPLGLTEPEIGDLIAFLASLTSPDYKTPAGAELARQRKLAEAARPYRDDARAGVPKAQPHHR